MSKQLKRQFLSITHPEIAKQWHPTKNGKLTPNQVSAGSELKVWWLCLKRDDHEWESTIYNRTGGPKSGCPCCSGHTVAYKDSLAYLYPELAKQLYTPELALGLKPNKGSKRARWVCSSDPNHIYEIFVRIRLKHFLEGVNSCAICNSLAMLNPKLAKEWHPEKNGKLTPFDVKQNCHDIAWWLCSKNSNHEWEAKIDNRNKGRGCPFCSNKKINKDNSLAITHPHLVAEWHPDKNGTLTPYNIGFGSGKEAWWQCITDKSHVWKVAIECRAKRKYGCPYCNSGWTIENIRNFILSIKPYLHTLEAAELYVLFQQNGLLYSTGKGSLFVKNFLSEKLPKEEVIESINDSQKFTELIEKQNDQLSSDDDIIKSVSEEKLTIDESDLPVIQTKDILESIDTKIMASADEETVDFLIKSAVAKIWRHTFYNEKEAQLQLDQYQSEGEYPKKVKKLFLEGYQGAKELYIPQGYNLNPPNNLPLKKHLGLMQRYVAFQIKKNNRFGNWSGTGAGKTLSAILASRVIGAKLTIVCCPNNVIDTWQSQLSGSYPDSVIYTKESILKIMDDSKSKYLLLNYEFFQQPTSEKKLKNFIDRFIIDFIVIDEIHQSKQRTQQQVSKRKMLVASFLSEATNKNSKLSILGMSATPVINNLFEGKTLLELITGIYYHDLNTQATITNCVALYKKFVSYGIRYVPNYSMQFNLKKEPIDCVNLFNEIKNHKTLVELEGILVKAKLPFILEQLQPKTIVYTHYRDGIEVVLQEAIVKKGWNVALYNGSTKEGLNKFINGEADILIATSCIGTGIDGLQKVCNRLIISCLPWTHAEYKQLIGRIYRQGQIKDTVDIIIPLTFAEINGERWSWCESRWKRIEFKKSIADAAVDGVIPEGQLRSVTQAHKDIMKWFDRLSIKGLHEIERSKISLELSDDSSQLAIRKIGDLSRMNCRINNESSQETHKRFLQNPKEWDDYHVVFKETKESWPVIPNHEALRWCKERPHSIIGDFGCGEALLAKELKNKVYSFDHVAINENVTACDMAKVPLKDETIHIAIFSLSLMGTNFVDYLKEAKRCLKIDGWLWIAEATSRIKDIKQFEELLVSLGFYIVNVESKDRFTFIKAIRSDKEINEILVKNLLKNDIFS